MIKLSKSPSKKEIIKDVHYMQSTLFNNYNDLNDKLNTFKPDIINLHLDRIFDMFVMIDKRIENIEKTLSSYNDLKKYDNLLKESDNNTLLGYIFLSLLILICFIIKY